jgi:hypothetical protein
MSPFGVKILTGTLESFVVILSADDGFRSISRIARFKKSDYVIPFPTGA